MFILLVSAAFAGTMVDSLGVEVDLPDGWSYSGGGLFVHAQGVQSAVGLSQYPSADPPSCDGFVNKGGGYLRDAPSADWTVWYAQVRHDAGNYPFWGFDAHWDVSVVTCLETARGYVVLSTTDVDASPNWPLSQAIRRAVGYQPVVNKQRLAEAAIARTALTFGVGGAAIVVSEPFPGPALGFGVGGGGHNVAGPGDSPVAFGGSIVVGHGLGEDALWFDGEFRTGLGGWLSPRFAAELTAGLRCDTFGSSVMFACTIPVSPGVTIDMGHLVRLYLAPRANFLFGDDPVRKEGQDILPVGDEFGARWELLIGDHDTGGGVGVWTAGEWLAMADTHRVVLLLGIGGGRR